MKPAQPVTATGSRALDDATLTVGVGVASIVLRVSIGSPALAVVIPAGPNDDIADTIDSVLTYVAEPRRIVIINDTGGRSLDEIAARSADIDVIEPINLRATRGGKLMENIANAYLHLLNHFEFDALLRMDADALIVGPGLAEMTMRRLAEEGQIGLLGANRFDQGGGIRDWSWAAGELARSCGVAGLRHPRTRHLLHRLRGQAVQHGYTLGEGPQGGGYIHSPALVSAMADQGFLDPCGLSHCLMGEDQIFGLLAYACGFRIGEFSGVHGPLGVRWRGLHAAPPDLIDQGCLVVHSVRSFETMSEEEIRRWFRDHRHDELHRQSDPTVDPDEHSSS